MTTTQPTLDPEATHILITWVRDMQQSAESPFAAAREIVTRLGAYYQPEYTQFGFWTPELAEQDVPDERIWLEVLTPQNTIDATADEQMIAFGRVRVPLLRDGDFTWGVVRGLRPGTRAGFGDFYRVRWRDADDHWHTIIDPLAHSIPFGVFAPAELYDIDGMYANRADAAHFGRLDTLPDPDGVPRIQPPTNILQIHVPTASAEGTLAGLTRIYRAIAAKLRRGEVLSPAEQNYIGYDAVQLMPVEPIIEYEAGQDFWVERGDDPTSAELTVTLRRPDMSNWGYDVMIAASPAVNPVVLETRRPDELLDLVAVLHTMPGKPIKFMLDIVYGHIDNQALPLVNQHFFAGANMYGQNVNFLDPVVRAMLLEMQRRKHNYGVDGIRVDGAQDFKNWDPDTDTLWHDDAYLGLMNDIELEAAGVQYRPWMIFEDGRPWPRDDWELSSTYREVTRLFPNVFQWGPLTFAHNTPFLFAFWIMKWWRIKEMTEVGGTWVTGCANHDTLRRGTQIDTTSRINSYLGNSLPDIFMNAYDNPAARLFDYACMPGVPMDFINATMRAPWSFIRNTDDRYGVKVMSEESFFLDWTMTDERFALETTFPRLKAVGFTDRFELRRCVRALDQFVRATDYDLDVIAALCNATQPPFLPETFTVALLQQIARAWMDDVHDFCNVSLYAQSVDRVRSRFNLAVREFRRRRPWLMSDFQLDDHFDYVQRCDGSVVYFALRTAPDAHERLLFVANMEGAPREVLPLELPIEGMPTDGWRVALTTPGLHVESPSEVLTLYDSQGVVFARS